MNRHKGTLSLTIGFTLVAAFIVTTLVLYAVPETHWLKTTVFEPFLLLPLMTCIFLVLTSYAVTFFIMKSYLLSGAPILLYFGAGILTLGTGSLASSWFMAPYGPNVSITILNVSVLATAMFHMAGIIMRLLERRAEPDLSRRRLLLVMCWGSVLVSVALLSLAAVRGLTPTFFVPGTGPTLIRQATLMATLLLLVLSFACMMVFYFETKIRTLCWYALALGFLLVGIGSIYLDNSVGSILGWLGRLSQYFAGVYFVVASVSALNAARKNGILLTETLSDAFQRSERRVSAILESMTDCHYELDRNLLFTRINDKALAFFKKNRKDLIGHSIAEVFNLSIDNLIPRFTKVMNERVGVHFEFESELEPGKWVEVHSYPVENGISVYFRDISEHKQKENEIRHLASFPGLNPNPVIEADLQGNICYLNTAAENVLSPRPLSLNSWMIGFDGLLDKVTKSTEPIRSEIHIGAFWYEYTMHYIASIQRIRMYLREITKRKEMEEELQKSKEDLEQRVQERTGELSDAYETLAKERQRLYDILESFPYMVCLLAPDYHVVFANKKFRETFGESGGKRCYKCCHGDRTEPCGSCESFTPLKTGQPHQWEAVAPNGRVIAAYDVPFTDADGSPMILEFDMDITEHRKMEQQLRQSQKMEAIGTLAGGIAHDFNNILAGILGFAEMAFEDAEGQRQIQKSLSYILKATKRGKDLVKQILSFSRKTDYQRSPVPVTPVIKETIKLLRASIPATIDLRLSATAQTDTVVASPTELQQIIMNLSTNAFKAMEDKGGVLDISLSDALYPYLAGDLEHSGEYLQLMVKDTGVGMTPEVMRKAFDPFFTTSEPGKGTGMGLSVVYGIVRNLNGEITVSSEPGDGSIFTVFLPKTVAGTEKKEDVTSELLGGNETILYVEDEQLLNELGKTVLEKLGYMVHAFDDPEKALLAFSQNPSDFDLVITDHAMPKMSGSELAWGIRNLKRDIPIIMCTGYQEPMTPEKAKEIGIADILSKPLRKQELAAAVRRVLDQEKLSQ